MHVIGAAQYLASGTDAFVMLVFHANLLTLCAFIVGFHTHAATIAAFVFQVSQHNRNELVRHAFDFLGGGLLHDRRSKLSLGHGLQLVPRPSAGSCSGLTKSHGLAPAIISRATRWYSR